MRNSLVALATLVLAMPVAAAFSGTPAVPEPASWAMLIAGFGLTGAALRRRRARAGRPAAWM